MLNEIRNDVGLDVPAQVGMSEKDIETPALVVDLDAFECNLKKMRSITEANNVKLRAHAKAHKSADIAHQQIIIGGADGFCCQKVSEAEALVAAEINDILISNQIITPSKIERLVSLSKRATLRVCVDDMRNVVDLSKVAKAQNIVMGCLVEIDVGAGRCGINPGRDAARLAYAIAQKPNLRFDGLQAYHGPAQHYVKERERTAAFSQVIEKVRETVAELEKLGLSCETISGAGTGTFQMEAASGLFTELQAGTYCLMDASYMMLEAADGKPAVPFKNALFVLTTVISAARLGAVVCDAGHKSSAIDSGMPKVHGVDGVIYTGCNDEHGMILDPNGILDLKDRLRLIPGHCDPTCNLHDYLVGIRNGLVETVWPVTARGKLW